MIERVFYFPSKYALLAKCICAVMIIHRHKEINSLTARFGYISTAETSIITSRRKECFVNVNSMTNGQIYMGSTL